MAQLYLKFLQLQLDAVITKVFELSKEFQKLNGNIKIRTDHIDAFQLKPRKLLKHLKELLLEVSIKYVPGILSLGLLIHWRCIPLFQIIK